MSEDFLGDRRQALEEKFFAKENVKALEKLRAAEAAKATIQELAASSGIKNEAVLEQLAGLGFTAETLVALSLYPLVAVAWADRKIDPGERRTVLDAAREAGMTHNDACHELLESWLEKRPGIELQGAWADMVGALKGSLDDSAIASLRDELLDRAREVAKAAGGVLGFGSKISPEEQDVLDALESAFS